MANLTFLASLYLLLLVHTKISMKITRVNRILLAFSINGRLVVGVFDAFGQFINSLLIFSDACFDVFLVYN